MNVQSQFIFAPSSSVNNCKSSNINSTLPQGNLDALQMNHSYNLSSGEMSCRYSHEHNVCKHNGCYINVYKGHIQQLETVYADISALTISTLVSIMSTEDNT